MSTARNGNVELAFDVAGRGPDLLLVAGTASTRPLWSFVRPQLARSFRTIAFDNRDSGESSLVTEAYTFAELARDAAAVLDAASAAEAHVLGHSMGGVVAQEFALAFPHRCRSLTLACSWGRNDGYTRSTLELMDALTAGVADDRTLLAAILWVGAGLTTMRETDLWTKVDAALSLGPLAPRAALLRQWRLDSTVDTLEQLQALRMPAHVIWCNEDRMLPQPLSRELAAALPGALETCIAGCGHLPMVDRPEEFVAAVTGFLQQVECALR